MLAVTAAFQYCCGSFAVIYTKEHRKVSQSNLELFNEEKNNN